MLKRMDFVKGVSVGIMAGAALGMALAPRKVSPCKKLACRMLKAAGEIMENITDAIGI